MPNDFAYIALIIWPFVSLLFYKQLPIIHATFWTIIGGFLLLPAKVAFDFPYIPPLDKETIPAITALVGCLFIKKVKITLLPQNGLEKWLLLTLLFVPFITVINNQEIVNFIPGLTFYDTFSAILNIYLKLLPLIIGMQLIKTSDDQLLLFKLLVISCLLYSLPILFEVRMSPQLHTWVYGFFPHDFVQQVRSGGFRPVVFIGHGLAVSMFIAISLGAAAILLKERVRIYGISVWFIIIYLYMVLLLSKSVGALLLGTVLLLVIVWLPLKIRKKTSFAIAFIMLLYPLLSILDLFPHQALIQMAANYDQARGDSLAFRFFHEKLLLEHAQQKIFFGWGGWGRNRLPQSVTDGNWIIILGTYGLTGFVSLFGLMFLSIRNAIKASGMVNSKSKKNLLLGHALIVSIIMIDQLPNASLSSWLLFLIGALLGRTYFVKKERNNGYLERAQLAQKP